jgi:hypothetical protein
VRAKAIPLPILQSRGNEDFMATHAHTVEQASGSTRKHVKFATII